MLDERRARSRPLCSVEQTFDIAFPCDMAWRLLHDAGMVASRIPGVSLDGSPSGDHLRGSLCIKLGPICTDFTGEAEVLLDNPCRSGTIRGQALDRKNNSRARPEVRFFLAEQGYATRAAINVDFTLTGPFARFSRGSIVQESARQLTIESASNLNTAIAARLVPAGEVAPTVTNARKANQPSLPAPERRTPPIGVVRLLWSAILAWLGRKVRTLVEPEDPNL